MIWFKKNNGIVQLLSTRSYLEDGHVRITVYVCIAQNVCIVFNVLALGLIYF